MDFLPESFKASSIGLRGGGAFYDESVLVKTEVVGIIAGGGGDYFLICTLSSSSLSVFSEELSNLFFFLPPLTPLPIAGAVD